MGASICTGCPPGKFSVSAGATSPTVCSECSSGKYSSEAGASSCTKCEAGKWSWMIGATSSATCTPCPLGTYSGTIGATTGTTCNTCPPGKTTNANGQTSESDCRSFCAATADVADGDLFNTAIVTTIATSHKRNYPPNIDTKFEFTCPDADSFIVSIDSIYVETRLSDGNSADRTWEFQCGKLNNGIITHAMASGWVHATGSDFGVNDQFHDYDSTILNFDRPQDSVCPPRQFMTGFRASTKSTLEYDRIFQIQCTGIKLDDSIQTNIEALSYSIPMYVNSATEYMQPFEIQDDGHYLLSSVNSTHVNADRAFTIGSRNACFRCQPGHATTSCTPCPINHFTTGNRLACQPCPPNAHSPAGTEGKDNCTCNTGYVRGEDGQAFCHLCEKGKYVDSTTGHCADCAASKYSTASGATSETTCQSCAPGETSPAGSDAPDDCNACAPGTIAVPGNPVCQLCDTAFYSSPDRTKCHPCPAGTWSATTKLTSITECTECGRGTYSTALNATSESTCQACGVGTFSDATGANSIATCQECSAPAGHFCPPGSVTAQGKACVKGYLCRGGAEGKTACSPGTYAAVGSSTCTVCRPGFYSDRNAAPTCETCDPGKTSPCYAQSKEDCFGFEPGANVCPPGFWRNGSTGSCAPCSVIGDIDDYYGHWERALRYTYFQRAEKVENADTYQTRLQEEHGLHRDHDLTMPDDRFYRVTRDEIARHCGLTADAVVCPHGMVADAHPASGCRPPPPLPTVEAGDCHHGEYLDRAAGVCRTCPRNLTTLYSGAWDRAACLLCLPGSHLHTDSATGEESCLPCNGSSTCHTTQTFGGARAHRMTSCSVPCGPEHMHEDNQTRYGCYFSQCMHRVRAQDIHPCALDASGAVLTNVSASRCHPYFVPVAPNWVAALAEVSMQDLNDLYRLYDSDTAEVDHVQQVHDNMQQRKSQASYMDWYYFFFATNAISEKLDDEFQWPHLRASKIITNNIEENSEAVVFREAQEAVGLLLAKDASRLRLEGAALQQSEREWPEFHDYRSTLEKVDLVRHVYEEYQRKYLQEWVEDQCNSAPTRQNNDVSMYHCHMKFYATKADPLDWTPAVDQPSSSPDELHEYQCHETVNKEQIEQQLRDATLVILRDECVAGNVSEACRNALINVSVPLSGLDRDTLNREHFYLTDQCNVGAQIQTFTAQLIGADKNTLQDVCSHYDNLEFCTGSKRAAPWFCYDLCDNSDLCLRFDALDQQSHKAVLEAVDDDNLKYVNDAAYMPGESEILETVRDQNCAADQHARENTLRRYSPEFPTGALADFVHKLHDRIAAYWARSTHTCRVRFGDGETAHPCVFGKDGADSDFFRVTFVNTTASAGRAYTLILTERAPDGRIREITHEVPEERVEADTTRPFCTVSSPAEFAMVRAAVEAL